MIHSRYMSIVRSLTSKVPLDIYSQILAPFGLCYNIFSLQTPLWPLGQAITSMNNWRGWAPVTSSVVVINSQGCHFTCALLTRFFFFFFFFPGPLPKFPFLLLMQSARATTLTENELQNGIAGTCRVREPYVVGTSLVRPSLCTGSSLGSWTAASAILG